MSNDNSRQLRATFEQIAHERRAKGHFGNLLKAAIRAGLCSRDELSDMMGVQPEHVVRTAANLSQRKVASISLKLSER